MYIGLAFSYKVRIMSALVRLRANVRAAGVQHALVDKTNTRKQNTNRFNDFALLHKPCTFVLLQYFEFVGNSFKTL